MPLFLAQNIKRNPRQFLARRKANSGYEIEICPCHQILARRGVYAGVKPFMKCTPGFQPFWVIFQRYGFRHFQRSCFGVPTQIQLNSQQLQFN